MKTPLERAKAFVAAIEADAGADTVESFFSPDIVQEEFPNRLLPKGAVRDLDALREAGRKGRAIMESQRYEIINAFSSGEQVLLETIWTGTLKTGQQIRARFAQVFEFRDDLIVRLRNYDCFEPF